MSGRIETLRGLLARARQGFCPADDAEYESCWGLLCNGLMSMRRDEQSRHIFATTKKGRVLLSQAEGERS